MERTKFPEKTLVYDIQEEPIVLSKHLLDIFLSTHNPADLIGLYCFYYYTAKWQRTNQPKATIQYTSNGMRWGIDKVRAVKKQLIQLGLIENIVSRGEGNRITGHHIKVNFIWRKNTKFHPMDFPPYGNHHPMEKSNINALSDNNINALSSYNLPPAADHITPSMFNQFWEVYPKKADKGKALTAWNRICSSQKNNKPSIRAIKKAILQQKKTERWGDPKYIPHPTTWLNQSRWLDDPKEMKVLRNVNSTNTLGSKYYGKTSMDYAQHDKVINNQHEQ